MVKKKRIFSIVGFPGVGKTTTIEILKNISPQWLYFSSELDIQLKLEITNQYRNKTYTNHLNIQKLYLDNSIKQIKNLELKLNNHVNKICILDRGFEDTWNVAEYFSLKGYFNLDELKNINNYWNISKEYFSHKIIFLYAENEILLDRVEYRDKKLLSNKRASDDFFMDKISNHYFNWYKNKNNIFILNTSYLTPNDVANKIKHYIVNNK